KKPLRPMCLSTFNQTALLIAAPRREDVPDGVFCNKEIKTTIYCPMPAGTGNFEKPMTGRV
ncbi:hypothetical protein, partial [Bacteroides heparinolyticus]|uniref:hypothetical protein n=1 Tax=Prevotella heparinolytica TaxID=28113 RepID=UPI0035A0C2D7